MERSGSQKFLLVISIIDIVLGVLVLLLAFAMIAAGGVIAADPSAAAGAAAEAGLTTGEVSGISTFVGLMLLIEGAMSILLGILGVRAANDNQKIMPVWWLSVIALVLCAIGLVVMLVQGGATANSISSSIGTLCGYGLMFWIANNIKTQAGK